MAIDSLGPAQEQPVGQSDPNKALNGHKLIILSPSPPPQDYLDRLRREHPGLKIAHHWLEFSHLKVPDQIPDEEWKHTTILLTSGRALPPREKVPKLEYVQITSAGANPILKHPLFTDTDISFCTANGVHG